jgi:hypothetical protein
MISTTMAGSSPVIVDPIAIRSMRTLREAASGLTGTDTTVVPYERHNAPAGTLDNVAKEMNAAASALFTKRTKLDSDSTKRHLAK